MAPALRTFFRPCGSRGCERQKKKKMLQYAQHVRIAMKFVDMVQRKGVSGDNDGDGASESAQ